MDTQIITKFKIAKPTKEVFEAIVDPERIGNFWFSSSSDRWEQGRTLTLRYNEYDAEVAIHVLEVEENRKIVFSWGGNDQETIVTITLKESDKMSTIIEVNESGLKEDDPELINKMIGQKEGWVYTLTCLKGYLENGVNTLRASIIF
ncbi:SRPBCC family protein [Peribacillus aracenensis]|uniref:SRPBCC family protein n=1 Tax=Peribacillus aracenensis TaxID=2976708 RepID=UPI0021A29AA1|nr:SRPBCC family protein [Peribacillus sp. BBB004]